MPPVRSLAQNFCTRGEYVAMSNGVFNFNFLTLSISEILGGPRFTVEDPTPPGRPLADNFFVPKASISQYLILFLIQYSSSSSFLDFSGSQI